MKFLFFFILFFNLKAFSQPDIEISNIALRELLSQNPMVQPTDIRDSALNFSDLIFIFFNPGIHTVLDASTGEALVNMSYSMNSCVLYEASRIVSSYQCQFVVGYASSLVVDQYNRITIDMGLLLSNGLVVNYHFSVNSDSSFLIEDLSYSIF